MMFGAKKVFWVMQHSNKSIPGWRLALYIYWHYNCVHICPKRLSMPDYVCEKKWWLEGAYISSGNRGNSLFNEFRADPELEAIRQRRMQELMAHRGVANPQNAGQQKAQEEAKQEAEERWQMMLAQILSSEARERRKFSLLMSFLLHICRYF